MNLLDMFFKGGLVMYPILVCSIIVVFVAIERMLVFSKGQVNVGQFMMQIRSIFQNGDVNSVLSFSSKDAPIARIVHCGLTKYDLGTEKVFQGVVNAAKEEGYRLKRRLALLASITGIAPMLGLLGTATSLVVVLQKTERIADFFNSGDFVGGLWSALLSTVFGLLVGIVAFALYNYFLARVAKFVHEMDVTASELLDLLQRRNGQPIVFKVQEEAHTPVRTPKPRTTLVFEDDAYFRKKG